MRLAGGILVSSLWMSVSALASPSLCSSFRSRPDYGIARLLDTSHRITFENEGGIRDGGVCWWRAELQRAIAYLAEMKPDQPRPTPPQVRDLLEDLRSGRRVVEIPGYETFADFSLAWRAEIQKFIEDWQKRDGFLYQRWLDGISSPRDTSPKKLQRIVDELDEATRPGDVAYVLLKLDGISSHGILITKVEGSSGGPRRITFVDMNKPGTRALQTTYRPGDRQISFGRFQSVPALRQENLVDRYRRAAANYCH